MDNPSIIFSSDLYLCFYLSGVFLVFLNHIYWTLRPQTKEQDHCCSGPPSFLCCYLLPRPYMLACTQLLIFKLLSVTLSKIFLSKTDSATEHNFTCILWKSKQLFIFFCHHWWVKGWNNQLCLPLFIQEIKMTKVAKQMRNTDLLKMFSLKALRNPFLAYITCLLMWHYWTGPELRRF